MFFKIDYKAQCKLVRNLIKHKLLLDSYQNKMEKEAGNGKKKVFSIPSMKHRAKFQQLTPINK